MLAKTRFQTFLRLSIIFTLLFSAERSVAMDFVQGRASIEMNRQCKQGKPRDVADYNRAVLKAKVDALRKWTNEQSKISPAYASLFAEKEAAIVNDIDRFLLDPLVKGSCQRYSYTVNVRAGINESAISGLISGDRPEISGPRSRMTAVFVARKKTSVKSFDAKVTSINETQEFSEAEQSANVVGESMSASGYTSNRNVVTSGGSTVQKADVYEYDVFRADGLDAAVNQTFASYGYRIIDSSQVAGRFPGFDVEAFRREFGSADQLSEATKNAAFNAISGTIPLFVLATLDVDRALDDPVSGQVRVYVTVAAQVYRDDGLFYEQVASVQPTVASDTAPTASVAETKALVSAARLASREIVNQLTLQGVY